MIQTSSIILLGITVFITLVSPILLTILWVKKTHTSFKPFFIGAAIFILFALVLETMMHSLVLGSNNFISNNVILYVLYGCLAAAIFEEGGRFIAFKYFMKNDNQKENAVTFGIGHGGIEMILLVSMSLLSSLVFAWTVNSVGVEEMLKDISDEAMIEAVHQMITTLNNYGITDMIVSLLERLSAMTLHVSCSILVFKAVKSKNMKYFLIAFGFHFFMNMPAALAQKNVLTNIWIVELLVLVIAAISGFIAYKEYKSE